MPHRGSRINSPGADVSAHALPDEPNGLRECASSSGRPLSARLSASSRLPVGDEQLVARFGTPRGLAASRTRRRPDRPPPARPWPPRSRLPVPPSRPGRTRTWPARSLRRPPGPGQWTVAAPPGRCSGPRHSVTIARGTDRPCRAGGPSGNAGFQPPGAFQQLSIQAFTRVDLRYHQVEQRPVQRRGSRRRRPRPRSGSLPRPRPAARRGRRTEDRKPRPAPARVGGGSAPTAFEYTGDQCPLRRAGPARGQPYRRAAAAPVPDLALPGDQHRAPRAAPGNAQPRPPGTAARQRGSGAAPARQHPDSGVNITASAANCAGAPCSRPGLAQPQRPHPARPHTP